MTNLNEAQRFFDVAGIDISTNEKAKQIVENNLLQKSKEYFGYYASGPTTLKQFPNKRIYGFDTEKHGRRWYAIGKGSDGELEGSMFTLVGRTPDTLGDHSMETKNPQEQTKIGATYRMSPSDVEALVKYLQHLGKLD